MGCVFPKFPGLENINIDSMELPNDFYNDTKTMLVLPNLFDNALDNVLLDSRVLVIKFGKMFNRSLDNVVFPMSLQSMVFSECFNQSLEFVRFPDSVRSIVFGDRFNRGLSRVSLPRQLQVLVFGNDFNQDIGSVRFPLSLRSLSFGYEFDKTLDNLPNSIIELTFAKLNMDISNLPCSVQKIKLIYCASCSKTHVKRVPYGCVIVDRNGFQVDL
ncbi:MAG: hypothetical protein Gaeavirus27_5 [Gaeavirus sp.]|uniref:FNIP repeat-containing protein n=1 Tax=Gaeavirus sp. TaxID=2487767 RepID=A0A3G5A498_9VIRU|nr:MAG: hypothetical protein Gaeavirus27_5 [Gaeavirus sp.]